MKLKLALTLAAGLSAAVASLASAEVANACTLIPGNNWAGAIWLNTTNDQQGGRYWTTVSPIGIHDAASGNHINQTLWVASNGATDLGYWTEVGYIKGFACDTTLEFYWADNRPNGGGFNKHLVTIIPNPVVGNTYKLWIVYVGNSDWNVNIGGSNVGDSTSNPGGSHSVQAGLETSTTSNYLPNADATTLGNKVSGTWSDYSGL